MFRNLQRHMFWFVALPWFAWACQRIRVCACGSNVWSTIPRQKRYCRTRQDDTNYPAASTYMPELFWEVVPFNPRPSSLGAVNLVRTHVRVHADNPDETMVHCVNADSSVFAAVPRLPELPPRDVVHSGSNAVRRSNSHQTMYLSASLRVLAVAIRLSLPTR